MDLTHKSSLARKSKKVKCGSVDKIPPDLQTAIHSAVYSGVPKQIAQHLGLSTKRLLNYCTDKPFKFSSRHLLPLMQFTLNYAPLEFLCYKTGHNLFKITPKEQNSEGVIVLTLEIDQIYQELSEALNLFFRTSAKNKENLKKIEENLWCLINAAAALKAAITERKE
jgi:hypothetical protein